MRIGTELTKKVGPIPRWILIGVIGGIGVGLYLRNRSRVEAATVPDEMTGEVVPATNVDLPVTAEGYGALGSPVIGGYSPGIGTESEIQIGVERALREWAIEQPAPTPLEPVRSEVPAQPPVTVIIGGASTEPPPPIEGGGPPAPIPKGPKAPTAPAPTKPGDYHAGDTVHNAANTVHKSFGGASGWIEIPTPDNRFADFHVAWPGGRLERWRGWGTGRQVPRDKRGKWEKIWQGNWR